MNPKNLKIRAKTSVEIDTPYLQINPSSTLSLNVDELGNVKISSDNPLGVKFMGMTVATLSEIEISYPEYERNDHTEICHNRL